MMAASNVREPEVIHMQFVTRMFLISAVAVVSVCAHAETRTLQFWTCTVNDGKTIADVHAANGKWLKFVNSKVTGGGIRSFVVMPVTGDLGPFTFIDSYPGFEAWAAERAAMATPEGIAVESELDAASKCTASSLSISTES
jgi:hypothetical protein